MKIVVNNKDTELVGCTEIQLEEPKLYQVCLHNDDYTPMEFVISVLEIFFFMDKKTATSIMMEAHIKGKAACGVFSKDVALTKITNVLEHARQNDHPLVCSMEAAI